MVPVDDNFPMNMSEDDLKCATCGGVLPSVMPGGFCPRCTLETVLGKVAVPFTGETSSPEIAGYLVHEEVGEGGFGIVYRATQTSVIKRRVALKILKPGVDTRQVLRRFQVEQQAMALLEHPNIAHIYHAGETAGGHPYFTMEYVEGVPITTALSRRGEAEILEAFQGVCRAIAHAHDKGVIHRDLKPSNILINGEGVPKVIDFGIAKATDSGKAPGMTHYTGGERSLGTPNYMAPEQADAGAVDLDERTDVFALGAILYEIFTGITPLDAAGASDPKELLEKKRIPTPSSVSIRKIPKALDTIIQRALAPDREKRYPSVREFAEDLHRYSNGDMVKRNEPRAILWPSFGALFLFLLAAAFFFFPKDEKKQEMTATSWRFFDYGFREVDPSVQRVAPFQNATQFDWFRFRDDSGKEIIFGADTNYESPSQGELFAGAESPDLPGARHVIRDSPEDKKLMGILVRERDEVIGPVEVERIENLAWSDLDDYPESDRLRKRKTFLHVLWSLETRRTIYRRE